MSIARIHYFENLSYQERTVPISYRTSIVLTPLRYAKQNPSTIILSYQERTGDRPSTIIIVPISYRKMVKHADIVPISYRTGPKSSYWTSYWHDRVRCFSTIKRLGTIIYRADSVPYWTSYRPKHRTAHNPCTCIYKL